MQVVATVSADLGIEEHVLANGQAQCVLRCLKGESEQPGVMRQGNLLRQLEWNLLLWVECNLGGGMATTAHAKLTLITHLLPVTHQVKHCTLTDCYCAFKKALVIKVLRYKDFATFFWQCGWRHSTTASAVYKLLWERLCICQLLRAVPSSMTQCSAYTCKSFIASIHVTLASLNHQADQTVDVCSEISASVSSEKIHTGCQAEHLTAAHKKTKKAETVHRL